MSTDDYKSENVVCQYLSDATPEECEGLIGKTIAKIDAKEYSFEITFTDGSTVEFSGNCWGSAMGVSVESLEETEPTKCACNDKEPCGYHAAMGV